VTLFSPLRIFLPVSAFSFFAGAIYGFWNSATTGKIPNGSVVLILFAVIVFLVGLVSEQITSLRFEGPEGACDRWSSSPPTTKDNLPASSSSLMVDGCGFVVTTRRRMGPGNRRRYAAANRSRVQILHRTGARARARIDGYVALRTDATHIPK
jgi:hypothetical protein